MDEEDEQIRQPVKESKSNRVQALVAEADYNKSK